MLLGPSAYAQPVADFTASTLSGCAPQSISFTNTSSGFSSCSWSFGNGNTSTLCDPSAFYTTAGTYTVTLTVSDGTATDSHSETIAIFENPTGSFSITDSSLCPNGASFVDNSTPGDAPITSWDWQFGDGGNSTAQNPTYTFQQPNAYSVTLIVTDGNGCTGSEIVPVQVMTCPEFTVNPSSACYAPATFTFATTHAPQPGWTWSWDFGDGNSGTGPTINHTYTSSGTFDVKLVGTHVSGYTDSVVVANAVSVGDGPGNIVIDQDSVCPGEPVNFFVDNPPPNATYLWNFGNNATALVTDTATYTYGNPGTVLTYLPSVTINWGNGCTAFLSTSDGVVVTGVQPPGISVSDGVCAFPDTVSFSLSGSYQSVQWTLPAGAQLVPPSTLSSQSLEAILANGIGGVTVSVVDDNGCSSSNFNPLNLSVASIDIGRDWQVVCDLPAPDNIINLVTNDIPNSQQPIVDYDWQWTPTSATGLPPYTGQGNGTPNGSQLTYSPQTFGTHESR